jgi:hypothetical protein
LKLPFASGSPAYKPRTAPAAAGSRAVTARARGRAGARAQESVWEHPLDRHYMDLVLEEPPRPCPFRPCPFRPCPFRPPPPRARRTDPRRPRPRARPSPRGCRRQRLRGARWQFRGSGARAASAGEADREEVPACARAARGARGRGAHAGVGAGRWCR